MLAGSLTQLYEVVGAGCVSGVWITTIGFYPSDASLLVREGWVQFGKVEQAVRYRLGLSEADMVGNTIVQVAERVAVVVAAANGKRNTEKNRSDDGAITHCTDQDNPPSLRWEGGMSQARCNRRDCGCVR